MPRISGLTRKRRKADAAAEASLNGDDHVVGHPPRPVRKDGGMQASPEPPRVTFLQITLRTMRDALDVEGLVDTRFSLQVPADTSTSSPSTATSMTDWICGEGRQIVITCYSVAHLLSLCRVNSLVIQSADA